jgi:hypothetical protein
MVEAGDETSFGERSDTDASYADSMLLLATPRGSTWS